MTEPIKIVRKRIKAFSIQEIAVILWVADHNPEWELMPYIVCNLWGSSRVTESFGLDWSAYEPEESALIFEAGITKLNQERVTENLPPVLLNWIKPYIKSAGPITPPESTVEWRRSKFLIPAVQMILPTFQWLRNGLRKTSISADYAITKDAKATAAKHGTSPEMLYRNYRVVMRIKQAEKFAALTRANLTAHLRGLIPDEELDDWDDKFAH
jgi:alpha-amylase/alpha-mannosidase (GH57 family)